MTMQPGVLPLAVVLLLFGQVARPQSAPTEVLADDQIRRILIDRIEVRRQGVGIVVGIIDSRGARVISHGRFSASDARRVDGQTVFQIGSVTKVFTSLVLADMVQRGEVALADPASRWLAPAVSLPGRAGTSISLLHLATHTSGLPNTPGNMKRTNPANPYEGYTLEQMHQFVSGLELPRDIGAAYEYSNMGAAFLGETLSRRAGQPYETLIRDRVTRPLAMEDTSVAVSPDMQRRMAPGHNARLESTPRWSLEVFAAAGALHSTANDLLKFIAVPLGYARSPLSRAFGIMYQPRRPTGMPNMDVALAWHIRKSAVGEIIWHNGGTGGYRSFVGLDLPARAGVVILSNTLTSAGVDDIGFHILDSTIPLSAPPVTHTPVTLDPGVLNAFIGRYQLAPGRALTITVADGRLFAQADGQNRFELFAEGPRSFFAKIADIQVMFELNANGRALSLTLQQGTASQRAPRIEQQDRER